MPVNYCKIRYLLLILQTNNINYCFYEFAKNVLEVILSSSRSVFNIQSLRMLMECENSQKLTQSLHYYIKEGKINNPRRGIYTKASYNPQKEQPIWTNFIR